MYAYHPNFSKSQLHQFWIEKGLQTNQSTGKLHLTFIEKIFTEYRLYFYAGYIYYPERGIEIPIRGKQDALISLDVVTRIINKEKNRSPRKRSPNLDDKLELHPLKGLINCTECDRKLGCYASKGNGGTYHYYTCGNKYCSNRINIRKEIMESQFEQLINEMKMPHEFIGILKNKLMQEWEAEKN